jgi:hypothetical protein
MRMIGVGQLGVETDRSSLHAVAPFMISTWPIVGQASHMSRTRAGYRVSP